jgi:hypothetical protein
MWDGNKICALAGSDLQEGVSGFGEDVPEALIDLVNRIRSEDTTIWVPRPARQFVEDGVLKCACPECGHIKEMSGFDEVIAYVCNECGAGVRRRTTTGWRRVKTFPLPAPDSRTRYFEALFRLAGADQCDKLATCRKGSMMGSAKR